MNNPSLPDIILGIEHSTVRNCKVYGILFYFQANKLAHYCIMDAGKRHENVESEIKDFITHGIGGSLSFMFACVNFSWPPNSTGCHSGAYMDAYTRIELCCRRETLCYFVWGRILPFPSIVVCYRHNPEKGPR